MKLTLARSMPAARTRVVYQRGLGLVGRLGGGLGKNPLDRLFRRRAHCLVEVRADFPEPPEDEPFYLAVGG